MTTTFHTLNELLPKLDGTARASVETSGKDFIIGVEHNRAFYPVTVSEYPTEADAIVVDLQRALDEHFGVEQSVAFDDEETQLLDGFTFVPNKGMAQIFVGKRNRLYLHGDIKTQLGIDVKKSKMRVLIAFNPVEKAFAIVKPTSKAVTDEMRAAGYFVSKRRDITCAKLFSEFKLDQYEGQTFYADTASLSGNVVIFRR